jgi:hypothetical protein
LYGIANRGFPLNVAYPEIFSSVNSIRVLFFWIIVKKLGLPLQMPVPHGPKEQITVSWFFGRVFPQAVQKLSFSLIFAPQLGQFIVFFLPGVRL